jgi:hypothetical protein
MDFTKSHFIQKCIDSLQCLEHVRLFRVFSLVLFRLGECVPGNFWTQRSEGKEHCRRWLFCSSDQDRSQQPGWCFYVVCSNLLGDDMAVNLPVQQFSTGKRLWMGAPGSEGRHVLYVLLQLHHSHWQITRNHWRCYNQFIPR